MRRAKSLDDYLGWRHLPLLRMSKIFAFNMAVTALAGRFMRPVRLLAMTLPSGHRAMVSAIRNLQNFINRRSTEFNGNGIVELLPSEDDDAE